MINKIKNHIIENLRTYFTLVILFIIGLAVGIIFVNHSSETQKGEILNYINSFEESIKQDKINYLLLLKKSSSQNIKTFLIILLISMSAFGNIGNVIFCIYKGFTFGYSVSSIISILGAAKGIAFSVSLIMLSKIIYIPAVFYEIVCVSKFYKKLINGDFENKKIETIKFIISIFIVLAFMFLSSLIETFISSNLFLNTVLN